MQKLGWVLLGVVTAIALFCLVIGVGCAINGVTFGQQIVNWFGPASQVAEVVDETLSTSPLL